MLFTAELMKVFDVHPDYNSGHLKKKYNGRTDVRLQ